MVDQITVLKQIELRASTLSLRSDGIMHIDIKPVDEFTREDVLEAVEALQKIGNGQQFVNLITFKNFITVDKETRKLAAAEITGKYTKARALVVNSTALKLVVNFFIAFNKPKKPTRMFDSEDKAVVWLKTFL